MEHPSHPLAPDIDYRVLKLSLKQSFSEPTFYVDLVYKLRKIVWQNDVPDDFRKIIIFMYGASITCFMRQTA